MNSLTEALVTIAVAITGVAMFALLVSKKSNTAAVIQAMGSAFGNSLGVAVSPVTGNDYDINLSYPNQTGGLGGIPSIGGMSWNGSLNS